MSSAAIELDDLYRRAEVCLKRVVSITVRRERDGTAKLLRMTQTQVEATKSDLDAKEKPDVKRWKESLEQPRVNERVE